ncbi:MAG: gliding motility-associated C-terminal domain-containing protein [Phaeodactylibacter sp.]|nr:gliding motility-associated C-terminal domain-containing protein [Phaeodactylibacter sp.]
MRLLLRTFITLGILPAALYLQAAHIIGGEITYECLGWTNGDPNSGSRTYQFYMNIYRDCQGGGAPFDSPNAPYPASITIYRADLSEDFMSFQAGFPQVEFIDPDPGNPCVIVPNNVCVQRGVYTFPVLDLPVSEHSYFIVYQRCCRNNTITNILFPESSGATYFMELTPEAQAVCNNSPTYDGLPPIVLCANEPFQYNHSASDAEGDQLVYEFCSPFLGGGLNFDQPTSFTGVAPNPDAPPPYTPVSFVAPFFSALDPLGIDADINIDVNTGLITGTPNAQGQFVVGVCVKEFRNGQLLSIVRRDFQFNVTSCDPTVVADIREDDIVNGQEFLITSCGNNRINFFNQSYQQARINEWFWTFGLGDRDTTINTWNATLDFPGFGEYEGRLVLNPGTDCGDTARIRVKIFPEIGADFEYAYDTCVAGPVAFTDLSSSGTGGVSNWNWDFGDGNGSSNQNPQYIYSEPGNRSVRLRITDFNGCQDSVRKDIAYFPVPALLLVSPSSFTGCAPGTIFFNNLSTPIDDSYDVQWDFGDGGASADISPEYLFTKEGTFSISLDITSPIGCQTDTTFAELITIEPSPVADFTYSPQELDVFSPEVQFTDQSTGVNKWFWDLEGVAYSTQQNPAYKFRDTGRQEVRLIVTHPSGCQDTAVQYIDIVPRVTYFLPNAFSPNDDSVNDIFVGKGYLEGVRSFELSIWNRWGEQIFSSNDPLLGWNGRKNNTGKPAPAGVYVCLARYIGPRGEPVELKGFATLIR